MRFVIFAQIAVDQTQKRLLIPAYQGFECVLITGQCLLNQDAVRSFWLLFHPSFLCVPFNEQTLANAPNAISSPSKSGKIRSTNASTHSTNKIGQPILYNELITPTNADWSDNEPVRIVIGY